MASLEECLAKAVETSEDAKAQLQAMEDQLDHAHRMWLMAEEAKDQSKEEPIDGTLPIRMCLAKCAQERANMFPELQSAFFLGPLPYMFAQQKYEYLLEKHDIEIQSLRLKEENHRLKLELRAAGWEKVVKEALAACKRARKSVTELDQKAIALKEMERLQDETYKSWWVHRHGTRCSARTCVWAEEFPPDCRFCGADCFAPAP